MYLSLLWRHPLSANRFYTVTSIFLVLLLGYLTYQILSPFLNPIAWAIVFSIVFYPVYAFLLKHLKFKAVTSSITLLIIILIILGPFSYLSFILVEEIGNFIGNTDSPASLKDILSNPSITHIINKIQLYIGIETINIENILTDNIRNIGQGIINRLSSSISNLADMFINFIFMLFAIFFFLKDGPDFLTKIRDYLPFSEENKNRLI